MLKDSYVPPPMSYANPLLCAFFFGHEFSASLFYNGLVVFQFVLHIIYFHSGIIGVPLACGGGWKRQRWWRGPWIIGGIFL
ncbi:unnamed protein product [Prunus brigantina]